MKSDRYRYACAAAMLSSIGCGTVRYAPKTPADQPVAGGSARVVEIVHDAMSAHERVFHVTLETHFPAGTRLVAARLGNARDADKCRGSPVLKTSIDGRERWDPDPVAIGGKRRIEVMLFGTNDLSLELVDEMGRLQCVQVPIAVATWRQVNPWFFVTGLKLESTFDDERAAADPLTLELGIARWFGALRTGLRTGITSGTCAEALCGLDPLEEERETPGAPLALDAVWFTPPLRIPDLMLGLGARGTTWVFWVDGRDATLSFAPQAMVSLRVGGEPSLRSQPGMFALEFAGFAGRLFEMDDSDTTLLGFGMFVEVGL